MATRDLPTPKTLRQLLRYDPETGKLFWRERGPEWFENKAAGTPQEKAMRWNRKWAGQQAFTSTDSGGYRQSRIGFSGRPVQLRAHRAIWAIQMGEWPTADVDHIDGTKSNNRWSNLRLATRSQNLANRDASGVHKTKSGWMAYVTKEYIRHTKGCKSRDEAIEWRNAKAKALHGEFARVVT